MSEVLRYLTWRPHRTVADTRRFLEHLRSGWESGAELTWALTVRGDDRLIGMIEKIGMTFEGTLRRWIVHPNVSDAPRDSRCYARVR